MGFSQLRGRIACALALAAVLLALLAPGATLATGNGDQARTSIGETTRWIVRLRPDVAQYASDAWLGAVLGDARVTRLSLPHTLLAEFDGATRPGDAVARLASDPLVASVEPDIFYTYEWEPNDPRYPGETWAKTVDLPDAWSIGTGRASVVVAVVDSGVRPDHPDLRGKLTAGYDFLNNDGDPTDTFGHGTAVAGIIAARGNDGVGVAGTAMDVMVMPVRVGDQQGAPVSAIAQGIHYAVDHGASVINLSLGSSSPSPTLEDAIQYAYSHNVVVVAAAGNDPNQASFPATYRETISVGATSIDGKALTSFSSRLSRVDLVAPGDGVLTTSWDPTDGNGYAYGTGTSFSAPIVSGTVALMRAVNPGLAVETIRADLTATAQQTLPSGTLGAGSGLLDAAAAARRAVLLRLASTWRLEDQPVAAGVARRTWLWGPAAFSVGLEPYAQTQHGQRLVVYYDKTRMEVTNPYGDPASPWYVTNGLLARELISGRMQVGDQQFEPRQPAGIPVAGDLDDETGPTYASLTAITGYQPIPQGWILIQTVDRGGVVRADERLASYGVSAGPYVAATNHRIASVFWSYMTSSGVLYQDGQYRQGPLFSPAFYATGYPITEAYWARVTVAGQVKDVLIQCFERRCLTYTPSNPAGWQVEMGNIGRHYYLWRYGSTPGGTSPEDPARVVP